MATVSTRNVFVAGPIVLAACIALGEPSGSGPAFDAADVHASPAAAPGTNPFMRGGFYHGGRYEIRNATVVDLIRTAYAVDPDKVTGGPAWLEQDRFDVIAKAPADSSGDTLRLMLQHVLADRFKLVLHNDTKPLPAYALMPGKKSQLKTADPAGEPGCKLQPQPDPPPGSPMVGMINMNGVVLRIGPGSLIAYNCHNITMSAFAEQLRNMVFVPGYLNGNRVVDETELKGAWDFDIRYSLNLRGPMMTEGAPDVVTIFNAVDKQLGLKLELTKVPMDVLAVDSVNRKPTDNLPGVTEKMPDLPTEFEVADIKPSAPLEPGEGFGRGGCLFCPGGRINLTHETMKNMISLAWAMNGSADARIVGLPKSMDAVQWDIIAKASTMAPLIAPTNGQPASQTVDFETLRLMMQNLLKDRFHLAVHEEQRPLPGYALLAVKPKLKQADPSNRTGCKEGAGADGKDPRTTNPAAGRLLTCLNMTMAEFAAAIPLNAGGYFFQFPGGVVDETKLEGAFDITLNFSGAGVVGGGGRGGGEVGNGAGSAGQASDPGGGITLQEALEKQLGLKLEPQKNPAKVLVVDHVEEKPTDN